MALTFTKLSPNPDNTVGNRRFRYRKAVPADTSYTTGGYTVNPSDVGLRNILTGLTHSILNDQGAGDSTKTLIGRFNAQGAGASKVQLFWSAASGNAPVEVTGSTDVSTYSIRLDVVGY